MAEILGGLFTSVIPLNLVYMMIGTFVGIIIGALPGLGPTAGMALLIPLTYGMDTTHALLLAAGIYQGAMYGGSITSVLLGIPGTPTNTATCFDGYPMSKNGQSREALGASLTASAIGGFFSCIALMFLTPLMSKIILFFGAPEQFMMAMVGLGIIAASSHESLSKGLLAGFFGLILATIGGDQMTGLDRFTFGIKYLDDGVDFITIAVGIFGLSQAIILAEEAKTISGNTKLSGSMINGAKACFTHWKVTLRSALMGVVLGVTPGAGGSAASMLAYTTTQAMDSDPGSYGNGNIKGVIAPEAANNATIGSAIIPTLSFGIPGSPSAAVLMGLLMIHNIVPGPRLFLEAGPTLYTFFWGLVWTSFAIIVIGFPLLRFFAKVTIVPYQILVPAIIILCSLGSYSIRGYMFDVIITLFFGILGYYMKKARYPMVCFVLGLILGPTAESNLGRSLIIYGDLSFIYTRPITLSLFILLLFVIIVPLVKQQLRKKKII
nr:tripartite tricarboxylate transporter permease [uncultured Sphaerochaeta sp.]